MQRISPSGSYQLIVLKTGETPQWDKPEEELVVGSRDIGSGYTQHWAYDRSLGKQSEELPKAQELASNNSSSVPAVIINQEGTNLELVLVKDGNAWARSDSAIDTLVEDVNTLVNAAQQRYNFKVEHFMTSGDVSPEVEQKLDSLESSSQDVTENEAEAEGNHDFKSEAVSSPVEIKAGGSIGLGGGSSDQIRMGKDQLPSTGVYLSSAKSSKVKTIVLGVVLLALISAVVVFRNQVLGILGVSLPGVGSQLQSEPTPSPTPALEMTPTPTPITLQRSEYQLRILNGTSQSGAAAALADKLKELGWKVTSVGNADSSDVAQTIVRVKKDSDDLAKVLVSDLAKSYEASISADLDDSSKLDAEVTIGKK